MAHDPALCTARLLADGYCIVPDACAPDTITALNRDLAPRFAATPFCEGGFYGTRTKRFGALLRRSEHAAALVRCDKVLRIVETVLSSYCDRIVLNLAQAVELHEGALAQIPHRDQDLWQATRDGREYQVNVIWPLGAFTAENGATVLWPGSHRPGAPVEPTDEPVAAEMEPGSAMLWLGSTLHGGGANRTPVPRRAVIVSYCLGWLRTFENQYLVYPPDVARHFDPELAELVGYAQHRPNLGNVEGQCPSVLLGREGIDGLPAIDALLPEQAEALAAYVADQEAARAGLIGG
ncbi:phytanoyl-CoA dioxygenase family protein [Novosphingobium sp. LASN5T]|nr:phytanoyl-CoA dioxygenase family protein [Novosphingobium sp. LASN5T]RQW35711.1 phytanoyl-CoA dioxygenase family protein [Novosphingobium sp. LASN5T]